MGNRKFGYATSCDQGIDTGEEWLIFGNLNDDQIEVFSCTRTSIYKSDEGKRNWQHPDTINYCFQTVPLTKVTAIFQKNQKKRFSIPMVKLKGFKLLKMGG